MPISTKPDVDLFDVVHSDMNWAPVTPQLTKGAVLDRESEKAEPNLRWSSIRGAYVKGTSHLERLRFLHMLAVLGH